MQYTIEHGYTVQTIVPCFAAAWALVMAEELETEPIEIHKYQRHCDCGSQQVDIVMVLSNQSTASSISRSGGCHITRPFTHTYIFDGVQYYQTCIGHQFRNEQHIHLDHKEHHSQSDNVPTQSVLLSQRQPGVDTSIRRHSDEAHHTRAEQDWKEMARNHRSLVILQPSSTQHTTSHTAATQQPHHINSVLTVIRYCVLLCDNSTICVCWCINVLRS
jgi:hypothetical protein